VSRRSITLSFWMGCLLAYGGVSAAQDRPGETLLPKTTAGFIALTNVDQLKEHWNQTQLGQLTNDPVMEPFTTDLRRQFEERWSGVHERLGLTLEDLGKVAGGEIDVAMIRPAPGEAAIMILVDVRDHLPQAEELLKSATNNLVQQGAKKAEQVVADTNVLLFELPKKTDDDPEAPPRRTVYFLKDTLLCAADNLRLTRGILARLSADRHDSLADAPGFQAVMERCRQDAGSAVPQIRWFIHPLSYADAVRAATPPERRRKGKSILELLQNQGFEALQGVGGFVDFSPNGYELLHRTAVYAPPPHEKSMKMLVFPNNGDFAPQQWVPREIATYSTFYVDILNAFDNFGPFSPPSKARTKRTKKRRWRSRKRSWRSIRRTWTPASFRRPSGRSSANCGSCFRPRLPSRPKRPTAPGCSATRASRSCCEKRTARCGCTRKSRASGKKC